MNFKQLNELLKDLRKIRSKNNLIERVVIHTVEDEGNQGDEGVSFEVYKLLNSDLHIKLQINTDSYGSNDFIAGIEFVQPIERTITKFEPLN